MYIVVGSGVVICVGVVVFVKLLLMVMFISR